MSTGDKAQGQREMPEHLFRQTAEFREFQEAVAATQAERDAMEKKRSWQDFRESMLHDTMASGGALLVCIFVVAGIIYLARS